MSKTIDDINLHQWFIARELDFVPAHFTPASHPVTPEAKAWILEKLIGRFALTPISSFMMNSNSNVAFEDPKEALFFDLAWG